MVRYLQADAYGGYGDLYCEDRTPAPIVETGSYTHADCKFFDLADVAGAAHRKSCGQRSSMIYAMAHEAVQRFDALLAIKRTINGKRPAERLAFHQDLSVPLMAELHTWLTTQVARLSRGHERTKGYLYMLKRWNPVTWFLGNGRICLTNNAAERLLRCIQLGHKSLMLCGSDRGGQRTAVIYPQMQTAKFNDIDRQALLADVLARIVNHPATKLFDLLPWNWQFSR